MPPSMLRTFTAVLAIAATALLAGCPAKNEEGVDFAKSQREARDRAKAVEQTVQEAATRRGEAADRQ